MICRRRLLSVLMLLPFGGCATLSAWRHTPPPHAPAAELTVQAPNWRVGSEWQYSDGYGMKVVRRDGDVTTFQRLDDPTQWVQRRGFLREDAQSGTTLRKLLFEDLPPGAGQVLSSRTPLTYRRDYMAGETERSHATSWTVEGRETVKVPAGAFDCAVLVMRTRNLSDGWTGFERWWYSRVAQNYVRMEYRYGSAPAGSRVLTRYRLAGQ
ncbi:MAG: hypothetical protein JO264_17970 [Acidisphaera sp.]|nr:hypothetical protein [Acidisphaera sp.]